MNNKSWLMLRPSAFVKISPTKRNPTPHLLLLLIFISLLFSAPWILLTLSQGKYDSVISVEKPLPTPDCATWNHTRICPKIQATFSQRSGSECPDYFRWIHEDLRHWRSTGITEKMVAEARRTAHFRITILGGKMYVEKFEEAFQSRGSFTLWGFAQLMRRYGGKLPDLELMFDCNDRPVVEAEQYEAEGSIPPPLFKYCADNRTVDIVFPDWSFWGWTEVNIKPWGVFVKEMKQEMEKLKWEDRVPYAYWKGNPKVSKQRYQLMKCNLTNQTDWNARLYSLDWEEESRGGFKHTNLANQCTHRYKIYAEGWGWSVSEKYILACNSPTLLIKSRWHDFFSRGLIPQRHYWPIRDAQKCSSIKFAVEYGNNHTAEAKEIGEAGSHFAHEALKMENVYDYMFHLLNEYAKLFKYKPKIPPSATELCSELLACPAHGKLREFMEETIEKSPSDMPPCKMPPPFKPRELGDFARAKMEAMNEVEAWEDEYGRKQYKRSIQETM
ncbi:O-glucosyltransferase rumi [Salvia divinorum]|uniref:O-glucosyltransferase rumi n=1 Tax=Salvia divinorum TaxID=28513 RepID=A0ABD1GQL7_SALDI